jgi:Ca-activated chloride channel family protein
LEVFSGTAFLQSPLSADYEILREFLPDLNTRFLPEGGTDYTALLKTTLTAFGATNSADRYLIILSDGEATDDDWKPLASELKTKGIRVIGLGIGTNAGAMIPDGTGGFVKDERGAVVLSKLESTTLQQLATETNGIYADASAWVDLAQLIQSTVDTGRKGSFVEHSSVRLAERFQWALAPAVLLLLWSFWREFPVRPRLRDVKLVPSHDIGNQKSKAGNPLSPSSLQSASPLLLLIAYTLSLITHLPARAEEKETPAAEPLSKLVASYSQRDNLAAQDFAELARTTIT